MKKSHGTHTSLSTAFPSIGQTKVEDLFSVALWELLLTLAAQELKMAREKLAVARAGLAHTTEKHEAALTYLLSPLDATNIQHRRWNRRFSLLVSMFESDKAHVSECLAHTTNCREVCEQLEAGLRYTTSITAPEDMRAAPTYQGALPSATTHLPSLDEARDVIFDGFRKRQTPQQ